MECSNIKFLFDMTITQPTQDTKFIGSGEYAIRILSEVLKKLDKNRDRVFVLLRKGIAINDSLHNMCKENDIEIFTYSVIPQISFIIEKNDINVVFIPLQYPEYKDLVIKNDVKIISVLHDLAWIDEIKMKSHYGMELGLIKYLYCELIHKLPAKKKDIEKYIEMFKKSLSLGENQRVITDSQYSKVAINNYIGINKIQVLYAPPKVTEKINDNLYENSVLNKFGCQKEKYILLISASRWRKNVLRAIEALSILFTVMKPFGKYNDIKVVVLGADEEHRNYFNKRVMPKDKFIIWDYVKTDELEALYKNAALFMYPSLLEGFGYPPLEAMKYGTPCICSKSMSIPEVCGNAAVYFDGFKRLEMIKVVITALNKTNNQILKKRAIKHYNDISKRQQQDLEKIVEIIISE